MSFHPKRPLAAAALAAWVCCALAARADDPLARPIDRRTVVATALRAHPALRAAEQRAHATELTADAEGRLPPPEAMVQVWQVPVARPYAISDAQMIMFGVGQKFPPPGARGARERATEHEARAERAMAQDRARLIRRDVEHAFVDYVESTARHKVHLEHRAVAERTLALARARHAGGASLTDVAQAEVELARVESDVVTDETRVDGARAKLNALIGREPNAPLGTAAPGEAEVSAWSRERILDKARESRPELRAAKAQVAARTDDAQAAGKEAIIPSFSVAALYFAPTNPVPQHGYGVNAAVSLPWLWGEASARRDARREAAEAARSEAHAARLPVDAEVASAEASMRSSALRLQTLRDLGAPREPPLVRRRLGGVRGGADGRPRPRRCAPLGRRRRE